MLVSGLLVAFDIAVVRVAVLLYFVRHERIRGLVVAFGVGRTTHRLRQRSKTDSES